MSKFAAQVVRDVNRESAIRVCVRRGDGKRLVEMLRSGLPNVKIELTPMASSLSAKLDVSVQVWEGQNEKLVWELCNVEKRRAAVATQWTLEDYYKWVKTHIYPKLADNQDVEMGLRILLLEFARDTSDWAQHEVDDIRTKQESCLLLLQIFSMERERCEMLLKGKPNDANLLRYQSAIKAGIDAAEETIVRAKKALQSKN